MDEYDIKCEEIRRENEEYLKIFEEDLKAAGLAPKTIRNHVSNAEFFINDYLMLRSLHHIDQGLYELGSFFDFFIHKCMWSTPDTVGKTATSIKKFYKCMADHGKISTRDYELIADEIKDGTPEWKAECDAFNNW